MKVHIAIDTRTFVRFWLVVIGFALVAFAIYSARTALIIVGASLFLAIALSPSVSRLAKRLPSKSRVLGTAIAFIAVVAALAVIVFLVIPPIVDQTVKFAQNVPNLVDSATRQYSGMGDFISKYSLQPGIDKFVTSIRDGASEFASSAGSILISSIGSIVSTVFTIVLVLVLAFLMLVEGPTWMGQLWGLYKDKVKMEHHRTLVNRMYTVVTKYVTGQLSVAAIGGCVAGLVVLILCMIFYIPINLAVSTAAIIFLLSMIPLFGATIGALIIGVILLLNSPTAAIIFVIYFVLYQQLEGNFISPKIQSKRIDLSALAILIAVLAGITMFGIAGGIISIPIAGCIKVLVDDYFARSKKTDLDDAKTIVLE